MNVPFFTLTRQYESMKAEVDAAVFGVLREGHFIMGPQVAEFESRMAEYLGVKHVVAVGNGTDALVMTMDVLGIRPGDEVVTTPYTFIASAECVSHLGGTPVFADVEPDAFTMDPAKIERAITPRTRAIIPVHIFGQPCDMDSVMSIAKAHNLVVVEDCAQAVGATYKGHRVGSIGQISCFSLFPTKNLGCYGDGGFVATDNADWAEMLRRKRTHGSKPKYYHDMFGYNSRLDTLQAAVVLAKLPHLDGWNARRLEIAKKYNSAFAGLPARLPLEKDGRGHIYHQYVIGTPDRDAFKAHLDARGVGSAIYYPLPMHLQKVYAPLGYKSGDLPVAEALAPSMLALPCFPELTDGEQQQVMEAVLSFFE